MQQNRPKHLRLADAFIQSNLQCIQDIIIFFVSMCSLGIEPTTFALLTQCSTTEPQEHYDTKPWYVLHVSQMGDDSYAGTQCVLKFSLNVIASHLN